MEEINNQIHKMQITEMQHITDNSDPTALLATCSSLLEQSTIDPLGLETNLAAEDIDPLDLGANLAAEDNDNYDEQFFLAEQDFLLYSAKETAIKLKNYLNSFINVTCYHEICNFIINSPRCLLDSLSSAIEPLTTITDLEQNYPVACKKIIDILQNIQDQLIFPAFIGVACKLNIGKIKVIYKVYCKDKLKQVLFSDRITNKITHKLMYNCKVKYPSIKYFITFIYEFSDNLKISLLTLYLQNIKFVYDIVPIHDLFAHVDKQKAYVDEMNSKSIPELAMTLWQSSFLVNQKQIIQDLSNFDTNKLHKWQDNMVKYFLQANYSDKTSTYQQHGKQVNSLKFIDYIANYILKDNSVECKQFKQQLIDEYQNFYHLKCYKMYKGYRNILTYLEQAGLEHIQLHLANHQFTNELEQPPIDLSANADEVANTTGMVDIVDKVEVVDACNEMSELGAVAALRVDAVEGKSCYLVEHPFEINEGELCHEQADLFENPFDFKRFTQAIVNLPLVDSNENTGRITLFYKYNCMIDEVISIIDALNTNKSSENSSASEFDSLQQSLKLIVPS